MTVIPDMGTHPSAAR